MKRTDVRSDSVAGMPTGSMSASDAAVAVPPVLSSPVEPVEGVLWVLYGARDVVARASRVPLDNASSESLADVVAVAARLRSAADALVLAATAALEAADAGSGRSALRERARLSKREARRTAEVGEQVAQMPNVARGLAVGELNVEHAAVLADAARRTSPDAVNTAAELLEAAAVVSPETLREQAKKFAARHDPAAAQSELGRQRRERCASLFVDESTGMGVLHAEFDLVSFALVRQAVETYNDALWRLDGGRDGTPGQIRDNRQRLADSLFEMVTDRNALATIDHPAAHTPNRRRRRQADDGRPGRSDADQGPNRRRRRQADDGGPGRSDADQGPNDGHRHGRNGEAEPHRGDDGASGGPTGRSVDWWRPTQAPNQLVIIAEIGVIDGTKPDGTCEMLGAGPVPPSILDDLSPDTHIRGALFDTNGEILWLGRSRRNASVAQQLAVAIRDRGCVLCRAPMHRCRNHHIDEWKADNGTTDIPNLAALCDDCHNTLHNNNQRLERRSAPARWTTTPRTHTTGQTIRRISDTRATGPP